MKDYRYILEPYQGMNTRHTCPSCNKKREFTLYIDKETGDMISDEVGKCNRLDKCGYHYTPKEYFSDNSIHSVHVHAAYSVNNANRMNTVNTLKPSYHSIDNLKKSLKAYDQNNFVKYLIGLFGSEITSGLISKYFIGTSKHWPGGTTFWQIDITKKIRAGKIMLYSPTTGKRIKEPFNHVTWVHSVLKQPEFELKQCFLGNIF